MSADVVVVIGAGGIGQAIARRQRSGRTVLLADYNETVLGAAEKALADGGHTVSTREVDVSSRESVRALAQAAAGAGLVISSMAGHMPPPLDRERGSPGTPNDPPCLRRPAGGYLEPWPSATPRGRTTTSCFPITSPP
jgi:NAD(P)-dependent dehydrogenase (short-subunit alcohol dehydrogenase family)